MATSNQGLRQSSPLPVARTGRLRLPGGAGAPVTRSVIPVEWFLRMPNGGTVHLVP